ncbi:MAG: ribulose-phosphate 3-epimerase [Porcipelethomonas sp.]
MNKIISASILSADLLNLGSELERIKKSGADMIHFDVMDGRFVRNISFGFPVLEAVEKFSDISLDVHLMIDRPDKYIDRFIEAGADIITIHLESSDNTYETLKMIKKSGIKAGLSIKPGTPFEAVKKYMEYIDMLLIMTVEPGFGGQKFMTDMLDKIKEARKYIDENDLPVTIQVDGGINAETSVMASEAGADILVAGNYLFKAKDMEKAVMAIR